MEIKDTLLIDVIHSKCFSKDPSTFTTTTLDLASEMEIKDTMLIDVINLYCVLTKKPSPPRLLLPIDEKCDVSWWNFRY